MKEPEREKGTEVATAVAANAYVDAVEAGTARLLFSDAAGTPNTSDATSLTCSIILGLAL